jgi:hypothetical protein
VARVSDEQLSPEEIADLRAECDALRAKAAGIGPEGRVGDAASLEARARAIERRLDDAG